MSLFLDSGEVNKFFIDGGEVTAMYLDGVVVYTLNPNPVITITGDNPVSIPEDKVYTDAGATAFDPQDGDITWKIARTGPTDIDINGGPVGAYDIFYDVEDSDTNSASQATRVVNVIAAAPDPLDLQIQWTSQTGEPEVTIETEPMLYTNDGWMTWLTLNPGTSLLSEGPGPYELREDDVNPGVTKCRLSQTPGVTSFDGILTMIGGSNLTSTESMFRDCDQLTGLDLSQVSISVTDMSNMFNGCDLATSIVGGPGFDTSVVTDITGMFAGCESITHLDFSGFSTSTITNMASLFDGCTNLVCITNLDTTGATSKTDIFNGCASMEQPSIPARTDLTDGDGAVWNNVHGCPDTL